MLQRIATGSQMLQRTATGRRQGGAGRPGILHNLVFHEHVKYGVRYLYEEVTTYLPLARTSSWKELPITVANVRHLGLSNGSGIETQSRFENRHPA